MKKRKVLSLVMAAFMILFAFSGCGNGDSENGGEPAASGADNSLKAVEDSGVLKVGMCPEYPPFESVNADNQIVGFDPSLAAAIAEEMGVEVECVNTPWEGLIAGLNNGEFDVVMSAMSPEEATAATEAVELSENYYTISDVIVVRADNEDIKSKEDLAGKKVGVQTGSTSEQAAEKLPDAGIELGALNPYNRTADAYAELASGRIDAVIVSSSYATLQAKENEGYKVVNDPIHEVGIAIVAKQGSQTLIGKMEEILGQLKENGKYDEIVKEFLISE